jgi:long-chain acyl-CoA synthetase
VFAEYKWFTNKQVYDSSRAIAAYLKIHEELCPREVDPELRSIDEKLRVIGIYSKNRYEWALLDCAAALSNITSVTLYDTLGRDSTQHIIEQCNLRTIACSVENVKRLVQLKSEKMVPELTTLIYFGSESLRMTEAEDLGINLISFDEVVS